MFAYSDVPRWSRRTHIIVAVGAALVFVVLAASYLWQFKKLADLDDYQNGYAVGTLWRVNEQGTARCDNAGMQLYAQSPRRQPGYNAFVAGCHDGQQGNEALSWWELRARIVSYD